MLRVDAILGIALSSVIIGLMVPFLLGALLGENGMFAQIFALLITFIIYLIMVFLLTILVSSVTSSYKFSRFTENVQENALGELLVSNEVEIKDSINQESMPEEKNTFGLHTFKNSASTLGSFYTKFEDTQRKNILEKSGDSGRATNNLGAVTINEKSDFLDIKMAGFEDKIKTEESGAIMNINLEQDSTSVGRSSFPVTETAGYNNDIEGLLLRHSYIETQTMEDKNDESNFYNKSVEEAATTEEIFQLEKQCSNDNVMSDNNDKKISTIDHTIVKQTSEIHNSREIDSLSADDYINKAFYLKQKGDIEGAISNYMLALDKKPSQEMVFWAVLDVCAIYKSLGQGELAKDILGSYIESYGKDMDESVRLKIEDIYSNI